MRDLFRLARPHFWIAGLGLYALGAAQAVAGGARFNALPLFLGYTIVLCAQASLSFSNDYFDSEADRFTTPGLFSGGSGVLVRRPELRPAAIRIATGLSLASVLFGLFTWRAFGYPPALLAFVAAGNGLAWFYAAPPLRLAHRGLGEISTAITAGLLLPGLGAFVARGSLQAGDLAWAPPLLAYGLCFILAVEIPDREADVQAGKRTWVVRAGRPAAFVAIAALCAAATTWLVLAPLLGAKADRFLFAASLVPLAVGLLQASQRPSERPAATRAITLMILALVTFFVLTDVYLVILATGASAATGG